MIRTRFAPSPTGELHVGGARTALFNYLFARSQGGQFILRIDDTDSSRSREEYESALLQDLKWLGLRWDEGPDIPSDISFRQSERGAFYQEWMSELKKRGAVYPCFCSEERLDSLRKDQLKRGEPPRYDSLCRSLAQEEAERRIQQGERPCWRLAIPERDVIFDDLVQGRRTFEWEDLGDFVLERSDGSPTYLFASVVDDHLMQISHVIRGDEHIPNTARQLLIIRSLGWQEPAFAHIPMILSQDRKKLGKRTGSSPIRLYRERGFLPEALDAYLATLSWTPPEGTEMFDLERLSKVFSLSSIVRSGAVHDEDHLLFWQKKAIAARSAEKNLEDILNLAPQFRPYEKRLLPLIEDMLKEKPFIGDIKEELAFLTASPQATRFPWMTDLARTFESLAPWNESTLDTQIRDFMKTHDLKGKNFFQPLREVLTGALHGASLLLILEVLGKEETVRRLSGKA